MLDGRDGDAVDVADGAVAEAQSGEDTEADVVFLHCGVLLADFGKTATVDGVERTFYLAPFVRTEGDERVAALVEFLQHFRTFEDEALQECHHLVGLMQQGLLVLCLLLKPPFLLFVHTNTVTKGQHHRKKDDDRSNDDRQERTTV